MQNGRPCLFSVDENEREKLPAFGIRWPFQLDRGQMIFSSCLSTPCTAIHLIWCAQQWPNNDHIRFAFWSPDPYPVHLLSCQIDRFDRSSSNDDVSRHSTTFHDILRNSMTPWFHPTASCSFERLPFYGLSLSFSGVRSFSSPSSNLANT